MDEIKHKIDTEEMVTITKDEYESLLQDSRLLQSLEEHGVDNWEGYITAYGKANDMLEDKS